jgi:lon-related putative ATP-dependent protease
LNKLDSTALYKKYDPEEINFETTQELDSSTTIIGQERLSAALEFGIGMKRDGYNIFALGPAKTNKQEHIQHFFESQAAGQPSPPDICYVNNFDDHYKPEVMRLPAGQAQHLEEKMDEFTEELVPILTSAFETEEYQNRRQSLQEKIQSQQNETFENLQEKAKEKGLALIRTPAGFSFAPLNDDGQMMNEDDIKNMPEEKRENLQNKTKELQEELQKIIQKMPSNQRKVREELKKLDQEIATYAIGGLFKDIRDDFSDLEKVQDFLDDVEQDVIDNVQMIMSSQGQAHQQQGNQLAQMMQAQQQQNRENILDRYRINVLVDNSDTDGAPVIYEDNPNYKNLIGRVEYEAHMGGFSTNFNLIKPGAMHQANGGYLILDARQVLLEPFAWEGLKRVLKSGKLKIESFGESYRAISTVSLEPEPISLDIKVILIGKRMLYYMLSQYDPDFKELFKVEADFEDQIDRTDENQQHYIQLLAGLINKNDLHPFTKGALARVIEQGSRMVDDHEKLSTQTNELTDLLKEANYWAGENNHDAVQQEDVEKAVEQQVYRSARLRDRIQESINRNTIFIDTEGTEIGQVNGLSVMMIGNLAFGQPTRITARVQLGKGDIVNIEREVDMSGPIHSKGVLILKGFLGERYAKERPLSLSASLVFEQSYSPIDGDSASCAELYSLLSAIGDIPLRQAFSVTGSVNQHGKVQPIGGVNEKIEGFFDVCNKRGLTGEQGVLIPHSNEKNLMLRADVREAAEQDQFHIYSVETIDEGMELLTGLEMGQPAEDGTYPEGTINRIITDKLNQFAENRKSFAKSEDGQE